MPEWIWDILSENYYMVDILPVSVVIPLYNKSPYIGRALKSVLCQTFHDFEVIVVDDGSTDDGAEIVKGFNDSRILLIQQKNQGESAARNSGIKAATADLIAFLDADDEWLPEFLMTIMRLRLKFPEGGAYATASIKKFSNEICQKQEFFNIPSGDWEGIIPSYFKTCAYGRSPICSSNVAIPKVVFHDVGMFEIGMWWGGDLEMWSRIALKYPIAFSSRYCAMYDVGAINRVSNTLKTVEISPFVRTARQAIANNSVPASILPDLERYIAKEILATAERNLKAGKPKMTRTNLSQIAQNEFVLKRITLGIWTYLPPSLFRAYQRILRIGLIGILRIKRRFHSKIL